MFESSPQSKCAVAYVLKRPDGELVNIVIVFSVITNSPIRIVRSESEITQMCTPGDDSLLIVGTLHGSLQLYDLKQFDYGNPRNDELDYEGVLRIMGNGEVNPDSEDYLNQVKTVKNRYNILWPSFSSDGLASYCHFSPIKRLLFITKFGGLSAQIGVIDELLTLSTWTLMEIQSSSKGVNEFDLSMSIGSRYKLLENFSENLMMMKEIFSKQSSSQDISQSMELEFDNRDPNIFYFSTCDGLFKFDRKQSKKPTRLDT